MSHRHPLALGLLLASLGACEAPAVEPKICEQVIEGCDGCGELGCACFADESCTEGECAAGGTCVRIEDGMAYVPAGPFWMGCREGLDADEITGPCPVEELPYREVTLDGYWIDVTEVMKGDYQRCMDAGVCERPYSWDEEHWEGDLETGMRVPGTPDFPAGALTWQQAKTYCEWVGKRLPTEAEWEKAARGTDGRKYPWGNEEPTCDRGNYGTKLDECEDNQVYVLLGPVGRFPAGMSPYGVLDMVGNVYEWTADGCEQGVGYESLPAENPTGIESDVCGILRSSSNHGSALAAGGYILRNSRRFLGRKTWSVLTPEVGVRCAADSPPG